MHQPRSTVRRAQSTVAAPASILLHKGYMRQDQYRDQEAGNEEQREKDGRDENMCGQCGKT